MSKLKQYLESHRGSQANLAREFNLDISAISRWKEREIPPQYVLRVEELTGVSRHDMRPDVFGHHPTKKAS